jgi:WD40 repeat protein
LLFLLVLIISVPVIFLSSCRTSVDFPCDFQGREYEREAGKSGVDQEVEEAGKQELLSFPTGTFTAGITGKEKIIEVTRSNPGYGEPVLGINTESTNLNAIAYSPDGKIIASGGNDMVVKLWDTETGNLIRKLVNHTGFVHSLTFSHDGKLLVSGNSDTNIVIWNVTSGEVIKVLTDHTGMVSDVAFSPNGKLLASGSWDFTIKVWNTVDWTEVETFTAHDNFVDSVHFSPDGKLLASGSDDRTLKFWNTTSWELNSTISPIIFPQLISAVRFSPDGKHFATGCWIGETAADLRLYDVESMTYHPLVGHVNGIGLNSIDFSPDGKLLATGARDETVRLWNVTTKETVKVLASHVGRVDGVAFSPDGTMIAACGMDSYIWLWNVARGAEEGEFIGHESTVYTAVFSPDGQTLASGSYDNNIILWNVTSRDKMLPLAGHNAAVHSVAFSPDGKLLVSGSWDTTVRLWNVTEGKELSVSPLTHHTNAVKQVIFSLDGTVVISGSIPPDSEIRLWNLTSGTEILPTLRGHSFDVSSLALSPDGSLLASGSWDSTIKIWNITSGQLLRTLTGHVGRVFSVAFSPDGQLIASGGWDNRLRIWNVTNGEELQVLGKQGSGIHSIAFSPDGELVAAGSIEGTIRFWNVTNGEDSPVKTIHVPTTAVFSVMFSPDGKILASGDNNGIIRLWNVNLIPDGDCDGMPDDWESDHGLDPLDFWDKFDDIDNDGLMNSLEHFRGTSPLERDSDGDGMPDGWEHLSGVDPAAHDAVDDSDSDGIITLYEFQTGLDPWYDDGSGDKDGDGLTNLQEFQYGSWANQIDSDLDGMPDGFEYEHGFEPLINDSLLDEDGDMMDNLYEFQHEFDATNASDALDDKDDDRMINQYEAIHGLNASNPDDANGDKDIDGMENFYEAIHGLDASNPADARVDNDGDWVNNVDEFSGGRTDPNDPWSFPLLSFSFFHAVVVILILFTVLAAFSYFLNDRRKKQLALTARLKAPDYPTALKIQKSGYSSHQAFIEASNDAKALVKEGNALYYQGEPVKAAQTHEQALTVFERLDDKLSIAATIFWIARIQKERQELIDDSAILKLFPRPLRDEPVIESIDHMLQALLAEAKKNWGMATESWQAALERRNLDIEFRLICQGAILEFDVKDWLDNPLATTRGSLITRLEEWQENSMQSRQYGNLCQTFLLRARIAFATAQFEEVDKWLDQCLKTAEKNRLLMYQEAARKETEILLRHRKRIQEELAKLLKPEEQEKVLQEYIKEALDSLDKEGLL